MTSTLQTNDSLETTLTEQQDQVDSTNEQALDPNSSGTKSAPKRRRGGRQQQPKKGGQKSGTEPTPIESPSDQESATTLRLDEITVDAGIQSRAGLNQQTVKDYAERMK